MAKKNKTEAISNVSTKIVPVVTTAIHKDVLNNDLIPSLVFKKDVTGTVDATGLSNLTLDFVTNDTIVVNNISQNFTISVSNMAQGERVFVELNKQLTNTVSFGGGIIDQTENKNYVNTKLTKVVYEILYKNTGVYAKSFTKTIYEATLAELHSGTPNKYVTPALLQSNAWLRIGVDESDVIISSAVDTANTYAYYRFNAEGDLQIYIKELKYNTSSIVNNLFDFVNIISSNENLLMLGMSRIYKDIDAAYFSLAWFFSDEKLLHSYENLNGNPSSGTGFVAADILYSSVLTLPRIFFTVL